MWHCSGACYTFVSIPTSPLEPSSARSRWLSKVLQDSLINQKVSITHARHFLSEVNRVPLEIVVSLFSAARMTLSCVNKHFFVNGSNIYSDEVLNVFHVHQLFTIMLVTLFVLTEECFSKLTAPHHFIWNTDRLSTAWLPSWMALSGVRSCFSNALVSALH